MIKKHIVAMRHLALIFITGCALTACFPEDKTSSAVAATPAMPAMPVSVLTIQPTTIPVQLEVIGTSEGAREIKVHARVSGLIEKQNYTEGAAIKAGDLMFQLERAPYEIPLAQAKATLAQQTVLVEQAKNEEQRLRTLLKQNAISQREYDSAKYAAQLAEANILSAKAKVREAELNLSYTQVTAPVSGITGRAAHSVGSYIMVGGDTELTSIIQVNPIWVRFSLAEKDFAQIKGNKDTKVELILQDGHVYGESGVLNFTATELDARLGTIALRAEFKNPQHEILPGQFVRVRLTTAQQRSAVLVPQTAIMQSDQGHFVYVIDADSKAAIRAIQTGEWIGNQWTVLGGLNAGDQVITNNLLKLRPGSAVQVMPSAEPTPSSDSEG